MGKYFTIFCVLLVLVAGYFIFSPKNSINLDLFAKCLKDKGATFYGAFWCPHCQNQKKLFGASEKYLPYVECSTPDGKGQTDVCKQKNITGYPTWTFSDESSKSGEISLSDLAEKTQCSLPK